MDRLRMPTSNPSGQPGIVVKIARYPPVSTASSKLEGRCAAGIAALSQICDSGRSSGTARHRKLDADHRALPVLAANRDPPAMTDDNDADQGEPDTGTEKAARGTAQASSCQTC
jgi:hypothetical protein